MISESEISHMKIVRDIMDLEVEKIKDFDGFDPSAKGQIQGMRILAKAIIVELGRFATDQQKQVINDNFVRTLDYYLEVK